MVTTHSQYITDFTPKTMEPGKSPLAMLAKTCETIGCSETPSKKSPVVDKKDGVKAETSGAGATTSGASKMPKSSPRSTPAAKEATLTFPGLPKPTFPMGGMPMPFPFFNPMMMPCPMPFPGFPMAGGYGARMPCPFAMMRQPCLTPGCTQCIPTSSTAGAAQPQFSPEMMAQFAAHPLFAAYAGMMPQVSVAPTSMPSMPSYQSLLASVAASSSAAANTNNTNSTHRSSPKTKVTPTTSTPSTSASTTATPSNGGSSKHKCAWMMESNVICGKKFADDEELASHIKSVHTPSPPSSASSTSADLTISSSHSSKTPTTSRPASSASQFRYNPYGKPAQSHLPNSLPTTPMMPQMTMNPMMMPFPLQAMYTQRLMSTMPHP